MINRPYITTASSNRPQGRGIRVVVGVVGVVLLGFTPSGRPTGAAPSPAPSPTLRLPAGCFVMGAQKNYSDERPVHRVCLSAHRLDRHEVTVARYGRCVAAGRCTPPQRHDPAHPTRRRCNWRRSGRQAHPMNCVTWEQAHRFCAWAGGRLPTEAEWERAARDTRATAQRRAHATCAFAVMAASASPARLGCGADGTRPVGTSPGDRSAAGVEDLTGNVSEWVADRWALGYYHHSPAQDPTGPRHGRAHGVRGCSYQCVPGARLLWPTARQFAVTWDPTIGFRCAGSPP